MIVVVVHCGSPTITSCMILHLCLAVKNVVHQDTLSFRSEIPVCSEVLYNWPVLPVTIGNASAPQKNLNGSLSKIFFTSSLL